MHSASVRADLYVLLHIPFRASFRPLSETLHTLLGNITNPNLPIKLTYPIMKTNRLQFSISFSLKMGICLFVHGIKPFFDLLDFFKGVHFLEEHVV